MANTSACGVSMLFDLVCVKIRLKRESIRTEKAYVDWIKRYLLFVSFP